MTYRLSPAAESDLDEAWQYVAEEAAEETANRLVLAIVERFAMLGEYPKAGRLRPDLAPGVRCFPVERYLIYYREQEGLVQIARVLHGSRDQQSAWREDDGA